MLLPFDLSQFPDLPPEVAKAFAAMQFELSVERVARQHEQAVVAEKDTFITELQALIEKLDPAQLELAREDQETAIAETQAQIAAVEKRMAAREPDPEKRMPRAPCKARALPESLPRVERTLEPDSIVCPCDCGDMVRISEDRIQRLDYIPARYQVIVTVRPPSLCLPQRARGRDAGQGTRTSTGGELADRGAARPDRAGGRAYGQAIDGRQHATVCR